MSVTFSVARESIEMFEGRAIVKYDDIYPAGFDPKQVIEIDPDYGPIYPGNPWSINVNNANARELLDLLKIPVNDDGLFGCIGTDLPKFLQECDWILQVKSQIDQEFDAGRPVTEQEGDSGCRIIDCGRRPGYITERVTQLRQLAQTAIENEAVLFYS